MYTEMRRFEWDDLKARRNAWKHGISFEEAATVFHDPDYFVAEDIAHSHAERRHWLLGKTAFEKVLVVIFTMRPGGVVRIISARPASRKERARYEKK